MNIFDSLDGSPDERRNLWAKALLARSQGAATSYQRALASALVARSAAGAPNNAAATDSYGNAWDTNGLAADRPLDSIGGNCSMCHYGPSPVPPGVVAVGNALDAVAQTLDPNAGALGVGYGGGLGWLPAAGEFAPVEGSLAWLLEQGVPRASVADSAKFLEQGFNPTQADYLAAPYEGMGHHFVPRRSGLPSFISDSPFNVLKPRDISRGDFYELHYKVDPHFNGTGLPPRFGGGSWSGKSLGLEKYGPVGRLWYGSPTPLKLTAGAAAAGAGAGAYEYNENDN